MRKAYRRNSLHDEIAHELRGFIQSNFKPGDCLPTIRDLAKKMETSTATLRSAQAVLCQEGFLRPVHGSGVYVTDRAAHRLVAVVSELNVFHPRVSSYYRDLIYELREYLKEHQVRTRLYVGEVEPAVTPPKEMTCVEFITDVAARRFDGVAAIAMQPHPSWMKWIERYKTPLVGDNHVRYQTEGSCRDGLHLLHGQGCRRVAALWWGSPDQVRMAELVAAADLETKPGWLRNDLHPSSQGAGWDEFREIWTASTAKPDGLLVLDDVLFEGAVDAIRGVGIQVPERLRIVVQTHGNAQQRYPFPLTALEDDPREHAQAIGNMLLQRMNGEPVPNPVVTLQYRVADRPAWSRGQVTSVR